jgi:anti-repressor protein
MEELVKVNINENNEQVVEGRELHQFLGVKTQYTKWLERKVEKYGFIENIDFITISQKRLTAQGNETTYKEHILKLSMAKELAMLENNEKGKQARLYFIKCEEEYKKQKQNMLPQDYIQALEKLLESEKEKEKLRLENIQQKQQLVEYEPKVTYYDLVLKSPNLMTITLIAKDYGKSGQWLNKFLNEKGVQYKQSGTWLLYQKYAQMGYTKSETFIDEKTGFSKLNTKWTQKGRLFIYELMKSNGYLPVIEQDN